MSAQQLYGAMKWPFGNSTDCKVDRERAGLRSIKEEIMKDRITGLMGLAKGCGLLTVSSCLVFSAAFPAGAQTTRIQQSEHILQQRVPSMTHSGAPWPLSEERW